MPTISVYKDDIFELLGVQFTDDEFSDLIICFGFEVDKVTCMSEEEIEVLPGQEDRIIYRVEIPANRYDCLCTEGLALALKAYLNSETPVLRALEPEERTVMRVKHTVKNVRPYVVCGILRGVTFTPESYASFIALQDKLHANICRDRKLVAIGTHDLSTIKAPFVYEARKPEDIQFVPLNQEVEITGVTMMDFYKETYLAPYLEIIEGMERYPSIYDSNGVLLSLPPIINGDHSKIKLETRDVFIESTAMDHTKACIVMNVIISAFSMHCDEPFTFERVKVEYENEAGEVVIPDEIKNFTGNNELYYPDMKPVTLDVSAKYVSTMMGFEVSAQEQAEFLKKMMIVATVDDDNDTMHVSAPAWRSDILHPVDVMEDVAISYGYDNFPKRVPKLGVPGSQQYRNQFSEALRYELVGTGFNEILTFSLLSEEDISTNIKSDQLYVKTKDFKKKDMATVRNSLLPGLLKTLENNSSKPKPVKLFEVSDVVYLDETHETGARNHRQVAAAFGGLTSGFETVHGFLDRIMIAVGVDLNDYYIRPHSDPMFFPGRSGHVIVKYEGEEVHIGEIGTLHPEVLKNFNLNNSMVVTVVSIDLELFIQKGE
ncbi:hypothetical protein PCE1_001507 [Barthelona sp. PCE]